MIGVFQCLQRHDEDARRKIIFARARMHSDQPSSGNPPMTENPPCVTGIPPSCRKSDAPLRTRIYCEIQSKQGGRSCLVCTLF